MPTLPDVTIANLAFAAGFGRAGDGLNLDDPAELATAVAIALGESGGRSDAHCNNCLGVKEDSRGLWQINLKAHPSRINDNLFDPATNAKAAYEISSAGTNFRPWTVYKTGAYTAFLPRAKKAVEDGPARANNVDPRSWWGTLPETILGPVVDAGNAIDDAARGVIGGVLGPIGEVADNPLGDVGSALGGAGKALSVLTSAAFWRVVGLVVAAAALIFAGGFLLIKDQTLPSPAGAPS